MQAKSLQRRSRRLTAAGIVGGGVPLLALAMALAASQGVMPVAPAAVWEALVHFDPEFLPHLIIREVRLPRVLAGALIGAALAVAGAVMQGISRNPMADAGLLGLSAGSNFALVLGFTFAPGLSANSLIICSFAGAAAGAVLVYAAASLRYQASPVRLVLTGSAVSALLTALGQGLAISLGAARDVMFWLVGGLAGATWQQLGAIAPWLAAALLAAMLLSRSISLLSLGEEVAQGLGLSNRLVQIAAVLVVVALAGAAAALAGAVGFVGLVVPHLARFWVGEDYRRIIPASAVLGALLLVLADLGARTIKPSFEIPVGAVTALIGVPFFLYLARRQRREAQ